MYSVDRNIKQLNELIDLLMKNPYARETGFFMTKKETMEISIWSIMLGLNYVFTFFLRVIIINIYNDIYYIYT